MCMSSFLRGVAVGMLAGAVLEMVVCPVSEDQKNRCRQGHARMGNAVDSALETVAEKNELKPERRGIASREGRRGVPLLLFSGKDDFTP